tara:strand:+ start:4257 stop:4718 length:462 start_codon:yes stop_codon:yes gene_type:complete
MWSHWTENGLFQLCWNEPSGDDAGRESAKLVRSIGDEIDRFDCRVDDFFGGTCDAFDDVRVDSTGWTPFLCKVYQQCRLIRAGSTRTYKQLATMAGNEKASRAVGAAMARNRVPLVIPCHRVVSAGGNLRGFSAPGGLKTKRFLLELEQPTLL